jgi:N-acetylglutamate synthase/N-acetylornithine aminotransferase
MSAGFGGDPNQGRIGKDAKITIDLDNIDIVLKQYKKIKKYQKSSLYAIKTMDGTEDIVSSLIKEAEENPL